MLSQKELDELRAAHDGVHKYEQLGYQFKKIQERGQVFAWALEQMEKHQGRAEQLDKFEHEQIEETLQRMEEHITSIRKYLNVKGRLY